VGVEAWIGGGGVGFWKCKLFFNLNIKKIMEIYAIYNWKISPFNSNLQDANNTNDHVLLVVLRNPGNLTLNTKTSINDYIVCNFPIKAIQAIIPSDVIEITAGTNAAGQNIVYDMVLNKIVMDNSSEGYVVTTRPNLPNKPLFVKKDKIKASELSNAGIGTWLTRTSVNLANVNVTISRDPLSC
jgi:hypothetical protein